MRAPAVAASCCLLVLLALPRPLASQSQWIPPQPPCDVNAGSFFRLNSAVVDLKKAAEQPTLREHLLSQALDVLTRTIRDDHQDKNPAAWYYLGRYYVERTDAAGADTAFTRAVALAPKCDKDVAGYRAQLYGGLLTDGQRTWQETKIDSSLRLLRLATRLVPDNPRAYFIIGAVFTANDEADSASAYLSKGVAAAGADTAYTTAKREALNTVARGALRHAQADPAAQQWSRTRFSRDSLSRMLANDSSVLARMQASAASRRARGARLSPADQRAFTTDSTTRAQTVERGMAARSELAGRVARDSTAVAGAFAPAVAAYQQYVAAFPTDAEAVVTLAALYSQSARPAESAHVFDDFFTHSAGVDAEVLFDLGQRLVGGGMVATGIKAYALGLQKNPWSRNALYEVGTAYVGLKDTSNAVATAQRLVALDPLNRASLHLAATAWDLRGRRDSAQKYALQADSTLSVDVTVGSFVPDNTGYVLTAIATNLRQPPAKPFRLTFEFLDARGEVQATQTTDVPALAPGANNQFQVRVNGKGLAGWRYRPS
jgi:tetratricopeptide (TPR) repeat protein